MKKNTHLFLVLLLMATLSVSGQSKYWSQIETSDLSRSNDLSNFKKDAIKTFSLNLTAFKQALESAPTRGEFAGKSNTIVSFPNEKGKITNYRVMELPILSPELSAENPNIKAYLGFSVENPNERIRFSVTPQGVQMMVSSPDQNTTFLVPLDKYGSNDYIAYSRQSKINSVKDFECSTEDELIPIDLLDLTNRDANDQILRTFRIAISTTGEYTNFWDDGNAGNGNAQQDALAQVVATLNRNNEVFEVDMAVTFQLVSGVSIIYPNAGSDPYTGNLNAQLQTTLTNNIGEANYDIGHLFHYDNNNGNAGCIGCVCVNNQKGSGFSSHLFTDNNGGPYMSDFFDIDYVPHEIGHQMGANHTYSFASEGTGVNYEPGSGTTIMGYAGITGSNDVQDHSDPYFHYASINQILNRLTTRTCWVGTPITNSPPVANAGNDYIIPRGTAFVLTASATDPDGADNLTYTWEELDNGVTTSANFGPTKATGALWRSRPPSASPNRYMPIVSRVINGQLTQINPLETVNNTSWETVSTVARTLNFGLTVRDRSEANGTGQFPQNDFDTMIVTVNGTAGPFVVTSQTSNVTWEAGSTQEVTWDVAGSTAAPVSTPNVNIKMSTDGGLTFPITLASNVPNNGSYNVTVPGNATTQARIIVEGAGNIFYAMNSSNFSIIEAEFVLNFASSDVSICQPNNAAYNFTYNTFLGFNGTTTFSASNLPAGAAVAFSPTSATADGTNVTMTVSNTAAVTPGAYTITVTGTSGAITKNVDVTLNVYSNNIAVSTLVSPANGATGVSADGNLVWNADPNAEDYFVEVATDAGFTNIINSATVADAMYTTSLGANTLYYWRVTASNQCATAAPSEVRSFTTANITCASFSATDLPIAISASGTPTITSVINVAANFPITDVNVGINITHTWDSDLTITLTSPNGTVVELTSLNGGNGDNYTNTVFDQQATNPITGGAPPFTGTFIPEGDLSTLNGEMSGGNWTLTVADGANQDGGSLLNFNLDLCVQGTLSVAENEFTDFVIFPNPNHGEFTIKLKPSSSSNIMVEVYDIRGRAIFNSVYGNSSEFNQTIQLNNAQSGMYLVKVSDGERQTTKKIIVD